MTKSVALAFRILPINITSGGDNIVIPAVPTGIIQVYRMYFTISGPTTITFKDGQVTDAGMPVPVNGAIFMDEAGDPYFITPKNTPFIINSSASVTLAGRIYYTISNV